MLSKKAKVDQYDAAASELDLMRLYLYDTQSGIEPIVVRKGTVRANLYRATGASGGYVVIRQTNRPSNWDSCNTHIAYFDAAYHEATHREFSTQPEDEDYRTVLERCRIERDHKLKAELECHVRQDKA